MKIIGKLFYLLGFLTLSLATSFAQEVNNVLGPQTLNELQDTIQKILIKTNTPGAGIVMISGDEVVLLEGFGKAGLENSRDVNINTMFRLGSVSKLFVGLAILKLQEEGRLNLKDKVSNLIPDLKISNPWENEYPIRVENLLEHTSGLNDWSFAELASNDPKPKTLKESLEYYPKGRVAHFAPGTRIQYSNLGTSIAAYIVESISGMSYENYIDKYFFKPMGMDNMTYRYSEQYQKIGAKGYDDGIPMEYWNVLYRPSAALTASPKDVANLLTFFINRGKVDSTQLISESSIHRMENGESLQISNPDIYKGYGLANNATNYKNFVYRGHGGSVPGSNSDFCYLPKYNLGYAIMINGNDQDVLNKISRLIKQYQTQDLEQEPPNPTMIIHESTLDLSGFYTTVNTKFEVLRFFDQIKNIQKVWHKDSLLYKKYMLRQTPNTYYQSENNEFRSTSTKRIGLVQIDDPVEGQVIFSDGGILKKISPVYAYTLLVIFWALFIIPATIVIFALLRLLIYFFGKKKNNVALWICLWPFVSIAIILLIVLALLMSIHTKIDAFVLLGNISPLSILIFVGTIGFALTSLWSIFYIYKNRRVKMARIFYYHSVLAAIFNLIFTIYFMSVGLIGVQTWA